MTTHPEVLWAQRSSDTDATKVRTFIASMSVAIVERLLHTDHLTQNVLYVKVNLPDIQGVSIVYDLKPTSISFKAKAGELVDSPQKVIDVASYFLSLVLPKG